jgi:hypothetical protein
MGLSDRQITLDLELFTFCFNEDRHFVNILLASFALQDTEVFTVRFWIPTLYT